MGNTIGAKLLERDGGSERLSSMFKKFKSFEGSRLTASNLVPSAYSLRMNVPLLPPLFLTRRISPIVISRSTALHMS